MVLRDFLYVCPYLRMWYPSHEAVLLDLGGLVAAGVRPLGVRWTWDIYLNSSQIFSLYFADFLLIAFPQFYEEL